MPWGNSKEEAVGQSQGDIQAIIDNSAGNPATWGGGTHDPIQSLWAYYTKSLDQNQLDALTKRYFGQAQDSLYGQQQRDVGNAGSLATNQAFSGGFSNPYAFGQHAQSGIYGKYANAFGGLQSSYLQQMMQNPQTAYQSQLGANQSNYGNLYQLLALKAGLAGQRSSGVAEGALGGLIGAGGQIGGALAGKPPVK